MLNIIDSSTKKICKSPNYNFIFNKQTGLFMEWGKTPEENPEYGIGPNIADIEISSSIDNQTATIYKDNPNFIVTEGGCTNRGCGYFCYKRNGQYNHTLNMSLSGMRQLLDKLPSTICQIAVGITMIERHPQLWDIFKEIKNRGIACNVTVNGSNVTPETAKLLAQHCNAIAVSVNIDNRQSAYNAVEFISNRPEKRQTNIHYVVCEENVYSCLRTIDDCASDARLKNLNALVFLMFKNKNNIKHLYTTLTDPHVYKLLVSHAEKSRVPIGYDSCSAWNYLNAIKDDKDFEKKSIYVQPCCGAKFSCYISVDYKYHACSFLEDREEWGDGISVLECDDFINDIWNHPRTVAFRQKNIACSKEGRNPCKYFDEHKNSNGQ